MALGMDAHQTALHTVHKVMMRQLRKVMMRQLREVMTRQLRRSTGGQGVFYRSLRSP